jgi:methionyl-tRNA formyltransferase
VQWEAERLGIPVRTPASLKSVTEQQAFGDLHADVAVVVAYGLLLPVPILAGTRLGCYNGHASLLPRWRGAAPIQRAVMAGDTETGMMVMKMDAGLDTGPIALTRRIAIPPDMTAGELHDRLSAICAPMMVEALACLEHGELPLAPQPGDGLVYAAKIDKSEARIDWMRSARDVHNTIRGLSPVPGAWCEAPIAPRQERLKLLGSSVEGGTGAPGTVLDDALLIACGEGAIRLSEVQRAGGRPVSANEFLRGAKLSVGSVLR